MKTLIVDRPETITVTFPCDLERIGLPGYKIYQDGLVISTYNNKPLTIRDYKGCRDYRFHAPNGKRVQMNVKKIMFCIYNNLKYTKVVGMHVVVGDDGHLKSMADTLREAGAIGRNKRLAPIPVDKQLETIDRTVRELAMLKKATETQDYKPIAKYLSDFETEMLEEIARTRRTSNQDIIDEIWHAAYESCLKQVMEGRSAGVSLLWKLKLCIKTQVIKNRGEAKKQDRQRNIDDMYTL